MLSGGTARCWGLNNRNGDGTGLARSTPVTVLTAAATPLTGIAAIEGSLGNHTCARMADGTSRCWGENMYGQIGSGSTTLSLYASVAGL